LSGQNANYLRDWIQSCVFKELARTRDTKGGIKGVCDHQDARMFPNPFELEWYSGLIGAPKLDKTFALQIAQPLAGPAIRRIGELLFRQAGLLARCHVPTC
jgi:hypothetical protein